MAMDTDLCFNLLSGNPECDTR